MPQAEIDRLGQAAIGRGLQRSELARELILTGLNQTEQLADNLTRVPTAKLLAEIAARTTR